MERYDRQQRLPGVGADGQSRLTQGRALVVGLGGLGSPAARLLAGAGVGTVGLWDFDRIDATNLHRQTLYLQSDVGRFKVDAAADHLRGVDAALAIRKHAGLFAPARADELREYDVVVDGLDGLDAKVELADACARVGVPLVHAAAEGWEGNVTVFSPPATPCYHCLWPKPRGGVACADGGAWGPLTSALGSLAAGEAMNVLLGRQGLRGKLLVLDAETGDARTITLTKRPGCKCNVQQDASRPGPITGTPGEDGPSCPMPWNSPDVESVSAQEWAAKRDDVFLLDVREPDEFEEAHIPGAHLIPLGQLTRRLVEVPKDRAIVCVCAVGGRSARAADYLRSIGYGAVNFRGGMRAYFALAQA